MFCWQRCFNGCWSSRKVDVFRCQSSCSYVKIAQWFASDEGHLWQTLCVYSNSKSTLFVNEKKLSFAYKVLNLRRFPFWPCLLKPMNCIFQNEPLEIDRGFVSFILMRSWLKKPICEQPREFPSPCIRCFTVLKVYFFSVFPRVFWLWTSWKILHCYCLRRWILCLGDSI